MKTEHGSSRLGDIAEHYAITYLWDKGYNVFKNSGCTGPVDLIAIDKKGKPLYIDVKTVRKERTHWSGSKRTNEQKKMKKKTLGEHSYKQVVRVFMVRRESCLCL